MSPDLWSLYSAMLRSRLFEEAIAALWHKGLISGEMHLGTGEEAIIAGIVPQLRDGDAMALDHRGTAALLMRGLDPVSILRELLGRADGLCGGMGGHMHLYSKEHLAASSGIVGASAPAGVGFALAAQVLRPGGIAVAFFGEGAMNQGMLLEALNLAATWRLPVIFVCKDDGWAITTHSDRTERADPETRARGFGLHTAAVDGREAADVHQVSSAAIQRARAGQGPTFIHARCVHLEGHFLGYQLIRAVRRPLREMPKIAIPLTRSFLRFHGAALPDRVAGLQAVLGVVLSTARDPRRNPDNDPLRRARKSLISQPEKLRDLEIHIEREIRSVVAAALEEVQA